MARRSGAKHDTDRHSTSLLYSRTESDGKQHEAFLFPACLTRRSTDRPARPDPSASNPEPADNPTPFLTKGRRPQIIRHYLPSLPERHRLHLPSP
jgi:hypothetical protein